MYQQTNTCPWLKNNNFCSSCQSYICSAGESCSSPWSLRPLMAGGYGCVRFVRAPYTARKCLLSGHHLAMTSWRKGEAKLICIKGYLSLALSLSLSLSLSVWLKSSHNRIYNIPILVNKMGFGLFKC